jgi:tetratricopeptide (TPR) repeat protein
MKDISIQLFKLSLLCSILLWQGVGLIAQEPEIIAEIESSQVYEGESLIYRVTLNHVDNPAAPDLSGFQDFTVQSAGEVDLNSQQITIINGVRKEIVRRGRQFQFRLTPNKTGTLTIPAPSATIDGQTLRGNELTLKVIAADQQDIAILSLTVDREKVYPTQPFVVTLKVLVKGLPEPQESRDPLTVQDTAPQLTIDWMSDETLPKALQPELPWQEVLQKLVSRRGNGFAVNSIRNSSAFSFFEDSSLGFHPRPQVVKKSDSSGTEVDYWAYEFTRKFTAKSPGNYSFSPVSLKGTFATKIRRNQLQGESIFAKSNSLTVEVKDVPLDLRPDSYIGAIGKFGVVTELSPTNARVGDPMTLTISVNGTGSLEDAFSPDIQKVPEIESNFKTYDSTSQSKDNAKKFVYSIRPLSHDIKEFPSIPISYFDVESEKFVTLFTQPIPLSLSESQQIASTDVIAPNSSKTGQDDKLSLSEGGLLANYSIQTLRNEALDPKPWLVAWCAMFATAAIFTAALSTYKKRNADPAANRRRQALSRAQSSLEQLQSKTQTVNQSEAVDQVRRAITELVSDMVGLPAQGQTVNDIKQQLEQQGIENEIRSDVIRLLEQCEAAKFGSGTASVSELTAQAIDLLRPLHQQLRLKRTSSSALVLLILVVTAGCSGKIDEQTTRQFFEAEQSFEKAQSPKEFQEAALRYQQIIDSGVRSSTVFFNQANAWARAEQPGRAIAAFRQALRFSPRDYNIRANLNTTLAGITGLSGPSSSAVSYLYFWKDWFSIRELFAIETVLILMVLVLGCCWYLIGRFRALLVLMLIPTTVFAATCYQKSIEQAVGKNGVVVSGPVRPLKGDGGKYQPAFTGVIPVGTEFQVLERRRDWVQVNIEGVGPGWIEESKVVLY